MAAVPGRQSLTGLITRLTIEQGEADVWVEGPLDQVLYRYVLRLFGRRRVGVHRIEDLELPSRLEDAADSPGNRERVLYLASEVERELGSGIANFVAAIDRDFDVLLDVDYGPYVLATDSTCIEAYLWDASVVEKAAGLILGVPDIDADGLLAALGPILSELFLIKHGQHLLRLDCRLDSARSLVTVDEQGRPEFEREEYVTRLLNAGGAAQHREALEEKIESLRPLAANSQQRILNGHDFMDLLAHVIRSLTPSRQRTLLKPEALVRALATAVDWESLVPTSPQLTHLVSRLEDFR